MAKHANRLGKGLDALIPKQVAVTPTQDSNPVHTPHTGRAGHIHMIPIDRIVPNRNQPRSTFSEQSLEELAASIKSRGVLQPVLVRLDGDGKYELVAGERRWRAAKLAELPAIPAVVRELSDQESVEIALIENLQREDLGPLERAAAYQHYLDTFGGTVEDLATRLSESRANVANYLRLLKLQPEVCFLLGNGQLGMGQARALAGVADPQRQLALARLAARRNLSVRHVEDLARSAADTPRPAAPSPVEDARPSHLRDVERALTKATGLRVRLYPGRRKNSGRIVISYSTLEEFDMIAERLGGGKELD